MKKGTTAKYAVAKDESGNLYNCGELKSLSEGVAEIAICDCLLFLCGIFQMTGEVMRFPEERVRLFSDRDSMLEAAAQLSRAEKD